MMDGVPSLKPLTVEDGSIVFGRGSLSVAESLGSLLVSYPLIVPE